ncbi:Erythromycin esterase OS=Streptomyces glaucescens OX=1907 GN=SGLAU_01715 PE=4 SV=1 [Streptomyces glaucescens]
MRDPAQSVGQSAEARELRLLADDLVTLLDEQRPHLLAVSSPDELGTPRAPCTARLRPACCRYHHWISRTAPAAPPGW